jgi:hypothetical protein
MVDIQARTIRPSGIAELEHGLTARCIRDVIIAVPVGIAVWVGIVAACISFTNAGYAGPLSMGPGVGGLSGLFFGTWAAFVSYGPRFDDESLEPRS